MLKLQNLKFLLKNNQKLVQNNLFKSQQQQLIKFSFCSREDEIKRRENLIADKIKQELNATFVDVKDTSVRGSACGTMYKLVIVSPEFEGKSKVQQHQMVTGCLKEELSEVHGFNLKTVKPSSQEQEQQ
ncbi:BolA protein [Pseudocohnilembus persalinus]|uniref:BolA protein n=1 Tax=Pseudocohnilembus persalinus TaxID=266149 RepID=A0A0V0QRP0_PSEPJ|nr:BolA protein [Pseudocohnilembus persalinus]|eukprot:KRX04939.1 BolA protein [Pseudocohnilembus persalinus]